MSIKIIYNILQVISQKSTKQGQIKATQPSNNSRKCGTVYFMHIQWQTAQTISWKVGKHLLFQLTHVSIFHCFKFMFWPTSPGTEEQVMQQQCPTFYLGSLHQVFFYHFTQVFMTWEQLNIFVFVFSLHLWDYNHCVICTRKCSYSEMNGRQYWQADLQQGAGI